MKGTNKMEDFARYTIQCSIGGILYKRGFMCFLNEILDDEYKEEVNTLYKIHPDLWTFNREEKQISIFEIEDTNKLTYDKILKYYWISELIFDMDWRMDVFVTDKYGMNLTKVPCDNVEVIETDMKFPEYKGI